MTRAMKLSSVVAIGCCALLFLAKDGATTQKGEEEFKGDGVMMQEGVEPLTRGPIHEAFAMPISPNPVPGPLIAKQPPEPIDELPPEEKPAGANVVWIGGYFAWDDETADFLWISGFWRDAPPDRHWLAGHWMEVQGGWQWVSGHWASIEQHELEYLPPPPVSIDIGPSTPQPSEDVVYCPGHWVHMQTRYYWRPGFWVRMHPEWIYVPAHYVYTPAGCLFVAGYWDYALHRRGLLLAPVRIARTVWAQPNFVYRPRLVVSPAFLTDSLFVRAGFNRYYFGDYYATGYARHGFEPWFSHQPVKNARDPLFGYYRWQERTQNVNWENALRTRYVERQEGRAPRPPATLAQQEKIIQNIQVNQTININNQTFKVKNTKEVINNFTVIGPATKIDQQKIKIETVSKAKIEEARKEAKSLQTAAIQRQKVEKSIVTEGKAPTKATDPPRKTKVDLPKTVRAKAEKSQAPPLPTAPQQVEKPIPKVDAVKPVQVPVKPIVIDPEKPKKEPDKGKVDPKGKEPPPKVDPPKGKSEPKGKAEPKGKEPDPKAKTEPKKQEPKKDPDPKTDSKGKTETKGKEKPPPAEEKGKKSEEKGKKTEEKPASKKDKDKEKEKDKTSWKGAVPPAGDARFSRYEGHMRYFAIFASSTRTPRPGASGTLM